MRKHHLHLQGHEFVLLMMQRICEGAGNVLQLLPPPKPSPPSLREPLHICIIIVSVNNQQHECTLSSIPHTSGNMPRGAHLKNAWDHPLPVSPNLMQHRPSGAHTGAAGAKRAN